MKICNHEGCKYNCFGGGYCKFHQYKRIKKGTDDKKIKKSRDKLLQKTLQASPIFRRVRTRIRKANKKRANKNKEKEELRRRDRELWTSIWQQRPHIDFETNEPIYGEPLTLYFHHVLPKHEGAGGYPQFRYKKWNIVIVSWETHSKAENNIDLVPKIKEYRNKLLKTKIK